MFLQAYDALTCVWCCKQEKLFRLQSLACFSTSRARVTSGHRTTGGSHADTDFEIHNVRVVASQVVLDSALVESFNRALLSGRSLVFSYPTAHTQQSTVPPALPLPLGPCWGLRQHGAQHRHRPRGLPATASSRASRQRALDGTMTDVFVHLIAYQLVTLSGTGVSALD